MKNLLEKTCYQKEQSILDIWKKTSVIKNNFYISDEILGKISKKDFKKRVFILAEYFKQFKEKNIGILLPSSASCAIVIFALYIANKTPVILNWTLSKLSFDHCINFSEIKNIITSKDFLEKISINFLQEHITSFVFLEDFKKDISKPMKISGFLKSLFFITPKISPSQTAVLLFTSGTENYPKAIELSHENILENIFGTLNTIEIFDEDILLAFLPPFHSFGFTINTILPIITCLRTVFTPNPNDSYKINSLIFKENISIITSTPTFFKMILDGKNEKSLQSLQIAIIGSEKCSEDIYEKTKNMTNCKIIEGYGITECSPVISVNSRNFQKKGSVGRVLPNLECKIINIENKQECTHGEIGEIYISGKSVFEKYLDTNIENPFVDIKGKKFYKTGDLGHLDEENFLFISGRLKRFIKIAGEMISLSMIENVLGKKFGEIIIEAKEDGENTKIVIFSRQKVDIQNINNFLGENNFPKIIRISENIVLTDFPLLGTGKIDYKALRNMISIKKKMELNKAGYEVEEVLKQKIRELTENEDLEIFLESEFGKDIIIDSIDVGELMIFIRKKYNISKEIEISKIKTFKDLIDIIN